MIIIDLPYCQNFKNKFNKLANFDWSIWLDSNNQCITVNNDSHVGFNQPKRFDIASCWPYQTLVSDIETTVSQNIQYNDNLCIIDTGSHVTVNTEVNPFDILDHHLVRISNNNANQNPKTQSSSIPFWHGALGYFGYDLNQLLHSKLRLQHSTDMTIMPIMAVGMYAWALISDHLLKKTYIVYDQNYISSSKINFIYRLISSEQAGIFSSLQTRAISSSNLLELKPILSYPDYQNNFEKIKRHITDGDCYQINYSIRFDADDNNLCPWDNYQHLRDVNDNPFGCYFRINKNLVILSFSPERFISITSNDQANLIVKTEPIKGTRKKFDAPILNKQAIDDLNNSLKDRAENIMITDLMRNDLNKHCVPGSVKTTAICELKTFATVHHLVSTIQGQLHSDVSSSVFLKECFPGGSITGAPKVKAMQIIQELENEKDLLHRYIYCGSIGYININGNLDTSITIRTLVKNNSKYHYWSGGGIVADSECESEYNEILNKLIKTRINDELN